jgi:hypothetical protein
LIEKLKIKVKIKVKIYIQYKTLRLKYHPVHQQLNGFFFRNWLYETKRTCRCVMVVLWNRRDGRKSVVYALMDVSAITGYIRDLAEGRNTVC